MQITKLEYQKKDPNRVNVYVDEKFVAGLETNDIIRLGLYKGQEISPTELNKIISESEFGKLFNAVLNFLSFRPRSEWEVRQYLERKIRFKKEEIRKREQINKAQKIIENIIDKLRQIGQINDEEFARWYLEQRQTFRPMGEKGLKYELLKKGIPRDTIAKLLDSYIAKDETRPSDYELAKRALKKKFRHESAMKQFDNKAIIKMQRFLASRGFDWDTIKEVVDGELRQEYNKQGN